VVFAVHKTPWGIAFHMRLFLVAGAVFVFVFVFANVDATAVGVKQFEVSFLFK
jgi:hypothetical protein